jgi:hypothetical protein
MKYTKYLVCFLFTQVVLPLAAAKVLPLYRVEGGVTSHPDKVRQLTHPSNTLSDVTTFDEGAEDFSEEVYDGTHLLGKRRLYQSEEDKMLQERREMFVRNLAGSSLSLSFSVVLPPVEPNVGTNGDPTGKMDAYDMLRMKLLGEGSNENSKNNDDASIKKANEMASNISSGNNTVTPVVTSEQSANTTAGVTEEGYVTLREKLLGLGNDEKYQEKIHEELSKADEVAAENGHGSTSSKQNLRKRSIF